MKKLIWSLLLASITTLGYAQTACTDPNGDCDGDGIINSIDLDDDNDGILDCVERGLDATTNASSIFEMNGSSTAVSDKEFKLTPALTTQSGQAWSNGKIDFSKSFTLKYEANLGTLDANGADGIATVFHNSPQGTNATGITGYGIGAGGIANGIVLELDTYYNDAPTYGNTGDIVNDHGQIWLSGSQLSASGQLTTPVNLGNLEDGAWHPVVINWDVATSTLSYTVDGITAGTYTFPASNPISSYFGGTTNVYFGYTASTGGSVNDQSIRFADFCSDLPLELDTDNDGIPNHLDADADGDGCFDAVEGSMNLRPSDVDAQGRLTGGVDSNGVPLKAAGGQGSDISADNTQNQCTIILPVTFNTIEAILSGTALTVNWQTTNEKNNDRFEIYVSEDGENFSLLNTVSSKAVNGNSDTMIAYSFTQNIGGKAGLLSISMIFVCFVLILFFTKRNRFAVAILGFVLMMAGFSCVKSKDNVSGNNKKVFVQIIQVDKDGSQQKTKVVQATVAE